MAGPMANLPGAVLVANLWWYAFAVLRPAQLMRPLGLYRGRSLGVPPRPEPGRGGGPLYSRKHRKPVYRAQPTGAHDHVDEFDRLSAEYDRIIEPFSRPIFEEAVKLMRPLLAPQSRILDPSCGPGTEALMLAELVPRGEVIGMDLSRGMVDAAFERARARAARNVAFFQADVGAMPAHFAGRFDAVHCSLSFHHYPDPQAAVGEMHRVLRRRGHAFIIDAGPPWMKALGSPLAKWADPGWVAFHTGEELQRLFRAAGFSDFYWTELLPGIGMTIATK
jgi:ubiquinone/menaquinone biosynthesis C-methylase UbiE